MLTFSRVYQYDSLKDLHQTCIPYYIYLPLFIFLYYLSLAYYFSVKCLFYSRMIVYTKHFVLSYSIDVASALSYDMFSWSSYGYIFCYWFIWLPQRSSSPDKPCIYPSCPRELDAFTSGYHWCICGSSSVKYWHSGHPPTSRCKPGFLGKRIQGSLKCIFHVTIFSTDNIYGL